VRSEEEENKMKAVLVLPLRNDKVMRKRVAAAW